MDLISHSWSAFLSCFAAGYLLGRWAQRRDDQAPRLPLRTDISDAEIEAEIRAGQRIAAIRLYRQRSSAGLKEARAAVEAIAQRLGVRR